mgnify:CR=1 FL=1
MRRSEELKTTGNSAVYNKLLKSLRETWGEIHCSICPYNRCENANRAPTRSWKWRTKKRRQYNRNKRRSW